MQRRPSAPVGAVGDLTRIHRLAHVEASEIGQGTSVWQFASVIRYSKIGEDCVIASCAIVDASVIGNNCRIGHGASIHPGTEIGNNVFVGPQATFCNDRWPRVGKDGFELDGFLSGEKKTIRIGDNASIGAGAIILPGVTVGMGAFVAAGATVTKNVPPAWLYKRSGECIPLAPRRPERMRFV